MNRLRANYIGFRTIVIKEIHRFLRLWMQTLLPSAITTILYFLIFGKLIGPRIGIMGGFNYIQFIAPGLIMMAVITNTYSNVSGSFFLSKFLRSIEELLVTPVPNYLILLAYVTGGIARGFAVGIVVGIITLFFTHLHILHIFLTLLIIILSASLFSLAGFLNGIFARSFDDIAIIPTFVLTPLTYLGGVFYSISLLPQVWQKISLFNPILYMVDAFRFGILGIADINIYIAIGMIALFVIVLFLVCLYLLNKGTGIRS